MASSMFRTFGTFLVGIFTGIIFIHSLSLIDYSSKSPEMSNSWDFSLNKAFTQRGPRSGDEDFKVVIQWLDNEDESHKREDDFVAVELKKQVRVLCWVMTSPENLDIKAIHINATWGQRCNNLLFMSTRPTVPIETTLPVVELDVPEGRDALWAKTKAALKYIYEHHRYEADWILKADDDTFTIVENLRYLLKDHSPDDPKLFGRRFKSPRWANLSYMSGGAGYVLSREALKRFVTVALHNPNSCSDDDGGAEDVELGHCLLNCSVEFIDTRDKLGRQRFNPLNAWMHLTNGEVSKGFWLWRFDYYPSENGPDCCSDYAITFHYVSPQEMYAMEYFIYHMKPYGIAINYDQREIRRRKTTNSVTQTQTTSV